MHDAGVTLTATKANAAYLEIHRRIVEGELMPGAVLDQGGLARDLNISTTPIREALRRLEVEELVVMSAHRDARVAPLSKRTLRELYQVRLSLDPLAAALTAQFASDAEIEMIGRLGSRHGRTPAKEAAANRSFHRAIYSACQNSVLVGILDSLWDRSDRYRMALLGSPTEMNVAVHEHGEIYEALRARDADRAGGLVRQHIQGSIDKIDDVDAVDV